MDVNDPAFKEAKEKACKFYDKEHNLTREDRQELYFFFEQQFRSSLLLSSIGFATGVAIPFIFKKRGLLFSSWCPIFGGFIGLAAVPDTFRQTIYNRKVSAIADKYGKESAIYKVIEVTPDPLTKAFFWSSFFKKSSDNPQLRIKDPRTITDSTSGIVIDKPDPSNIPQYGKPEHYQNLDPSELSINQQQYKSSWDKIRQTPPASIPNTDTSEQGLYGFSSNTPSSGIDDDTLEAETDTDTDSNKSKHVFGDDRLINNTGPTGSFWDNISKKTTTDINKLFAQEEAEPVKFYNEEHNLTDSQRLELHRFFDATYKTTLTAKVILFLVTIPITGCIRNWKFSFVYSIMGGFLCAQFGYYYMTPTIFDSKLLALENKVGKYSPIYKVVKVTPEPAEYSSYWSEYFETSITQPEVRLKNPNDSDNFTDTAAPFGSIGREDHLIENKGVEGTT